MSGIAALAISIGGVIATSVASIVWRSRVVRLRTSFAGYSGRRRQFAGDLQEN